MQLQTELAQPLTQLSKTPLGVVLKLEAHEKVVGVSHDDDFPASLPAPPRLHPEVVRVMEVDVRKQGANAPSLRCSLRCATPLAIFQHACIQPLFDVAQDAPVRNPVLDKPHQPFVVNGIEEATNVCIEHPAHLLRRDPYRQRIQRIVLAAARSKPVRETDEVRFIDCIQHFDGGPLDKLVFECRYADRSLPPICLRDLNASDWLRSVRSALQATGQVLEIALEILAITCPRLTVDTRRGLPLETKVGLPKSIDVVDVMPERGARAW